jgi:hypothetical protein
MKDVVGRIVIGAFGRIWVPEDEMGRDQKERKWLDISMIASQEHFLLFFYARCHLHTLWTLCPVIHTLDTGTDGSWDGDGNCEAMKGKRRLSPLACRLVAFQPSTSKSSRHGRSVVHTLTTLQVTLPHSSKLQLVDGPSVLFD